jgi:hypothetical protein
LGVPPSLGVPHPPGVPRPPLVPAMPTTVGARVKAAAPYPVPPARSFLTCSLLFCVWFYTYLSPKKNQKYISISEILFLVSFGLML